jgi:hypothetical protein
MCRQLRQRKADAVVFAQVPLADPVAPTYSQARHRGVLEVFKEQQSVCLAEEAA